MRHDVMKRYAAPASLLTIACLLMVTAAPASAQTTCTLRGTTALPKGTVLYDSPVGGKELAQFTGGKAQLTVTSFPESAGGRASVTTSGFRLEGYVRVKDISVYTLRSVPTYAGHVWIADGRRVGVLGAAGGRLHVEKSVSFPLTGYFHGWAPCDAFTLNERVPSGYTPPGSARGYVVKKDRVELFSSAGGDVVATIEPASSGPGVLFFSTERTDGWLHAEYRGEIILDGWLRTRDVSALPPGETMDQLAPSTVRTGAPQLSLQGQPRAARVNLPVTLRGAASDAAPTIGSIETGTEILVLDVVAGWASVVPKTLEVMPLGSAQFWARAKDLGL